MMAGPLALSSTTFALAFGCFAVRLFIAVTLVVKSILSFTTSTKNSCAPFRAITIPAHFALASLFLNGRSHDCMMVAPAGSSV